MEATGKPRQDNATTVKAKQIDVRLSTQQERLLSRHCVREPLTIQEAVVQALKQAINGL